MMRGKIIRGVGGFYYIHPESAAADVLIECKAKGIFRNRNIKPLVGDNVEFEMLDEQAGTGNITEILPRRNALIRLPMWIRRSLCLHCLFRSRT